MLARADRPAGTSLINIPAVGVESFRLGRHRLTLTHSGCGLHPYPGQGQQGRHHEGRGSQGTDIERKLTADNGDDIWADSVTTDSTITKAWDAKHTGGGHSALYQGKGPEFLMKKFDDEMRVYGEVIRSSGNPVSSLTLVTNTPESLEFLGQRAREILGPDVELHIQLKP